MRRIVVFAAVCAIVGTMGADLRADELASLSIEKPIELNDSILISGNRFGLPQNAVVWPSKIVNLPEAGGSSELAEVLDGAAGLDVRSYNGYGSLSTLSNWGALNRHMLLLYNGRVVRDYSLGGFNLSEYSADELQRVEIVKGPQAAFYGSDAVGGVVNLVSNMASGDRLSLSSRVGSNDLREYNLKFSKSSDRLGLTGNAGFGSSDNARDNAGSERLLLNSRVDYVSTNRTHVVSFFTRYFSDSIGVPGPQPDPEFTPAHGSEGASSLFDHQLNENYSADLQYRLMAFGGETQVDLFREKRGVDYNSVWSDFLSGEDVFGRSLTDKLSSGATVRHQIANDESYVAGGLDWLYGRVNSTNIDQGFNFWSASQDQVDLWGSVGWSASYAADFNVSGRVQMVSGRSAQPSYNLGVGLLGDSPVRLRLAYGYAFRLPSIGDQFSQSAFVSGNPDLSAETSRSFAQTISFDTPTSPLSFEFTFFLQETDSLIQYRFNDQTFKFKPLNVERFESKGIDLSVRIGLSQSLSTEFEAVYQSARQSVSSGTGLIPAFYVPDLKARIRVGYEHNSLVTKLGVRFTSDRYLTMFDGKDKVLDKVYELDASVTYRVNHRLVLTLVGTDLTDRARPDQFGFTSSDLDYPSVGRRVNLSVNFRVI